MLDDRANEADDNGEALFEHLRANRPDINAWFVDQPRCPRPGAAPRGDGDRVVARGTSAFTQLMLNARG